MNYITEELKEEKDSVLEYYLERNYKVIEAETFYRHFL